MMKKQNKLGRGIVKWQPFASIPQQYAGVRKIIENQKKIPQPILDEEEQERINYILVEATESMSEVTFVYWINGRIETEVGRIRKMDHITKEVFFIDSFDCIYALSIPAIVDVVLA
ncbi:3-oxoacyl-ACP synthase [Bacillus sp. AFS077874]|uniref:YolD-like family protein n=1 Tax=unclassified Bacillus (in: firmicutes) TaxID=185979 RepID=UPI000BEB5F6F|nr:MULTISPECIES: YolD-like family protein [unclassified Bacillus (in: firmicutes)]PEC50953.1 3-oxoacyl-ACP synthase [Bacillus sp. AFS096315]PFM83255.1 3-oxoacyl-ACP synthase [Bacillus sp. AFS077874]